MATITERRRRALGPSQNIDELFEQLFEANENERSELLHERAWRELETGRSRRGMYAMALTRADGDRDRAGARYLTLRVDQLEEQFAEWAEERVEDEEDADRRAEAAADFRRTMSAVLFLVIAVIAILSWT